MLPWLRDDAAALRRAGIVFTQREERIVVAEVQPGTQAAACGLVHAGDVLKRTSAVFGSELWTATDFRRTMCGQRGAGRAARSVPASHAAALSR